MKMLSEYTDNVNRCARVFKNDAGYTVNFWDAVCETDEWVTYLHEETAENAAEDWIVKK